MDFLDYVQLSTGQRFVYKLKSFFLGIPGAISKLFTIIGHFFASFFGMIVNGFKGYGSRFANGDGGTKLSYIIMGAGNILHKQIGKGLIFLAAEVAYFAFLFGFGMNYVSEIFCNNVNIPVTDPNTGTVAYAAYNGVIGNESPVYQDNEFGVPELLNSDTLDDSNKILLFSVLTLIVTIAFIAIYVANTKSAYASQKIVESGKKPVGLVAELKTFLDERFHVTLLSIPTVLLLIFTVLPIVYTIFIAFTNYDKNHQPPGKLYWWVGFDNFATVFYSNPLTSQTFGRILLWTIIWAVFATFSNYILGIVLALMINKKGIKFKGFWRTMFVITAAVPQFVTLLVMRILLDDKGAINNMLGTNIPFLTDTTGLWPYVTVILVNMWVGIPYTMLISSGLLMNIPEDLYESARIDGANAFQQFTKITFPYIFFVTTPYLITSFVGNINNFNVIYFLTAGGPVADGYDRSGRTDLLVTWLYKLTINNSDFNLAAVIGILVFVICAAGSLITFNMSKASKNEEEFS